MPSSQAQAPVQDQLVYFISGMWCTSCAQGVREAVETIDGVEAAEVNYASKLLLVAAGQHASPELDEWVQARVARIGFGIKRQREGWILGFREELGRELDGRISWAFISLVWFLAMWSSMLAFAQYAGGGLTASESFALALASSAFGLPAILIGIYPYIKSGWRALRFARKPTLDLFVALGGLSAVTVTLLSLATGRASSYADSGAMIVAILLLTKKMENVIIGKVTSSLLFQLNPRQDRVDVFRKGAWVPAETAQIRRGDRVRILPEATIPFDGTLLSAAATVNGYLLNGENGATQMGTGDSLFAGTVALTGLELQVTQPQGQRRIDAWAETAMAGKPAKYPRLFARLEAGATLTALTGAAALGALAWLRGRGAGAAAESFFTGVLVFCPCLFASILPLTKQLAHMALLRRGIFLTRTEALLDLAGVRNFLFDKTGTLEAVETSFVPFERDDELAAYLAELSAKTHHPILRGLGRAEHTEVLRGLTEIPGLGAAAITEKGDRLLVGRVSYLLSQAVGDDPRVDRDFPAVALNGKIVGQIFVKRLYDQKTKQFLRRLLGQRPGTTVTILSGDPVAGAGDEWRAVDDRISYAGNLSPEAKAARVRPRSAFIGDGLNDTLALAAASVSFRVGQRVQGFAPVDFQLLSPNLNLILAAAKYAVKYRRVLWQTAGAAFLYNCAALVLVAGGKFSPLGAVLAMAGSFSILLLSSLRLLKVSEVS